MRAVALNPTPATILDHLGVLSCILKIPLLVTEQETYDLAKSFYPEANTILMPSSDLNSHFLASHYDVIFVSSKRWAIEMYPLFPLLYNKQMRIVYCPHGNSDKGHSLTSHSPEDVNLVYGAHMLDLLKDTGALSQIGRTITTGNYRYLFFKERKEFYQKLVREKVFSKLDPKKKLIFYSPTWGSEENPTSFFESCAELIEELPPSWNLLLKPHPYLYEKEPARTTAILEKYKHHPQVLFLEDFPPIFPLLELADVYLGDFSSIGYDFLKLDKPMYFFNTSKDRGSFLHQAGLSVPKQNVFKFIEETLEENKERFAQKRKKVCEYAFGQELPLDTLREQIFAAL